MPLTNALLPYSAAIRGDECVVSWVDPCGRPLAEPFFEDTIRLWLRDAHTRSTRRNAPLPEDRYAARPVGLIFHLSRCGSTLAAGMLRASGLRVISEAPPLDVVIQSGRVDWIRSMAAALAAGEPAVFKLDPWHVHALPLVREAFPETPWVFLYRDPVEVLASHARLPGRHVLPGGLDPRAVRMEQEDITRCPRADWPARVLARLCESALAHASDPAGLFVDHRDLPTAVWQRIGPHFGIPLDPDQLRGAAHDDAKRPGVPFVSDNAAKQADAAIHLPFVRAAGLDRLYKALRELDSDHCAALA